MAETGRKLFLISYVFPCFNMAMLKEETGFIFLTRNKTIILPIRK